MSGYRQSGRCHHDLIPGPDPGACPDCGGWVKAGMAHDCEAHRAETRRWAEELVGLYRTVCDAPVASPHDRNT